MPPATWASLGRSRVMIWSALAVRSSRGFSPMITKPLLSGRLPPIDGGPAGDVGILATTSVSLCCEPHHLLEGDVLRRIGQAGDDAGVLLREEALGLDDIEQAAWPPAWRGRSASVGELVAQHEVEAALIAGSASVRRSVSIDQVERGRA